MSKNTNTKENKENLLKIKESLENDKNLTLAENAKIKDPSTEVSLTVADFLMGKLENISKNDEFSDLIKMHIRQRLPEASFEELMKLHHELNMDNTKAAESVLSLFKSDSSEKTIIDNLRDSAGVSSAAQQLYNSTDNKDILQAVSYLSQVFTKISGPDNLKNVTPHK